MNLFDGATDYSIRAKNVLANERAISYDCQSQGMIGISFSEFDSTPEAL
jgi:hypothetical protein